jgi:hypothetical protein
MYARGDASGAWDFSVKHEHAHVEMDHPWGESRG